MSSREFSVVAWRNRRCPYARGSLFLQVVAVGMVCGWLGSAAVGHAEESPPKGAAVKSARAQALFDPTGYWVSLVTRDWRFRMVVPGRGEYQGIPLNLAGKQFADTWDAAKDVMAGKQCEAYGGGVVMLVPGRLNISWQDDETLRVQTDAGVQTRLLHFQLKAAVSESPRSWQGYSQATWKEHREVALYVGSSPPAPDVPSGSLKIVTSNMLPGLLRKNGVAYSEQSTLTEYWELQRDPDTQTQYLIVTAALHDPVYLVRDYHYTATFQKVPDGSAWDPTPCTLTAQP